MKVKVYHTKSAKGKVLVQAYSRNTFQSGQKIKVFWKVCNFYIPLAQAMVIVSWAQKSNVEYEYVKDKRPYPNYLKMSAWTTKKGMTLNAKDSRGIYFSHFISVDYPSVTNLEFMLQTDGQERTD